MSSEHLTERDTEAIRLYVEEGLGLRAVGARVGVSGERVRQIVTRAGVHLRGRGYVRGRPRVPPKHLRERNAEIARLYAEGFKLRDIGARFGLSFGRVSCILAELGVPRRRRGPPKWSPEDRWQRDEEIAHLYRDEGLTQKEIGARMDLSRDHVYRILKGLGVPAGQRRKPPSVVTGREQEIIRAYLDDRLSLKEVGARFDLSPSTVWNVLEKAGVPRRSQSWRSDWPWPDAEARSKEITHAYVQEGLSVQEMGTRFGLSLGTVSDILQRAGLDGRRWRGRDLAQRNQEIIRLYVKEGLTPKEIGARFDLGQARVCQIARRARDQEIARLYAQEGLTPKEIGTRFGLSPSTVLHVLRKAGVSRRRRGSAGSPEHLKERNDEIARLYAEGDLTLREIGERFSLNEEGVRQIARRAGVGPRVLSRPRVPREDVRERNAEIIRLYTGGLKLKEIAARFGLSKSGVDYVVRKAGVRRRRPGVGGLKPGRAFGSANARRKRNQAIVRLYVEERLTCREIGTQFGLTPHGVMSILDTASVPRRSGSWRSGWPWRDSTQRTEEITHAYLGDRLTLRQVAARFDLSPECVRQLLIRAGVPRRPAGRRAVGQETVE